MRRRDDDAVGECLRPTAIVGKNRLGDHRGRRDAVVGVEHDLHAVGRQHLEGGSPGRLGQGMRVSAEEERPIDPVRLAIETDRLGDGEDVRLVESGLQ